MAISVALLVGDAKRLQQKVIESFQNLKPGSTANDPAFGPLITAKAKQRVLSLIAQGKAEGATLLVDGSQCTVNGYENGNFVGPTLFSNVTTEMTIYQQEIFGPVLLLIEVSTLEEALAIINRNPYGNGCSIYTSSGVHAREFQSKVKVGQVGINIPIPVPMPFFSFTGWRGSFYGDLHAYGKQAVRFYTETKTVTSRWSLSSATTNMTIKLG
jgi:malonate-semialdehyde dehydrogenase (acetylating)/methylmalonate-semialdehyde dehydrogenase